jgi:small subunit ribosomal protein S17
VKHPLYGKIIRLSKKYHAHDEGNEFKEGETVRIEETRPISKLKTWRVIERVDVHAPPAKATSRKAVPRRRQGQDRRLTSMSARPRRIK